MPASQPGVWPWGTLHPAPCILPITSHFLHHPQDILGCKKQQTYPQGNVMCWLETWEGQRFIQGHSDIVSGLSSSCSAIFLPCCELHLRLEEGRRQSQACVLPPAPPRSRGSPKTSQHALAGHGGPRAVCSKDQASVCVLLFPSSLGSQTWCVCELL